MDARKAAEERERRIMLDTASRLRSEGDKWERVFGGGANATDCYRGANALEELAGQAARTPQITDEMVARAEEEYATVRFGANKSPMRRALEAALGQMNDTKEHDR